MKLSDIPAFLTLVGGAIVMNEGYYIFGTAILFCGVCILREGVDV